ncbi:MAG: PEGA domain-containing protein [Deltaproteobacteria bacterium]|nr:PEGA domain-containing protein [Deltaproteobacteria bacterium]
MFNVIAEEGVTKGKANMLTEILIDEITKLNRFKVIGQKDLDSMFFWEQNKQLKNCTDSSCLAQIAGAMGAEYYVEGSVGQIGDRYIIAIKLINAYKVEVVNRLISKVYKSDNALLDEMPKIVKELFDPKRLKKEFEDVKGEVFFTSGLDIVSEPVGAKVIVNNEYKGVTPLKIEKLRNGRHVIVAKKEGYKDEVVNVILNKDEIKPVMIKLRKKICSVSVETVPESAEVFFQGKKYYTPARIENVTPGKYEMKVYNKKYGERKVPVVVMDDNEETKVVVDFEATTIDAIKKYKKDSGTGYFTIDVFYSFGGTSYGDEDPISSHILQLRTKLNIFPFLITPQFQFLATHSKYYSGSFSLVAFSTQRFELFTFGVGYTQGPLGGGPGAVFNLYRMNIALHSITRNNDFHLFIGFVDGYSGGNNFVVSLISLGLGWGSYMF